MADPNRPGYYGQPVQGTPYYNQSYPQQYPPAAYGSQPLEPPAFPQYGYGSQFDPHPPEQSLAPDKPMVVGGGGSGEGSSANGPEQPASREYEGTWHDVWATVLFVIQLIAVAVLAAWLGAKGVRQANREQKHHPHSTNGTIDFSKYSVKDYAPPLFGAVAVGFVFSIVWLQLMRMMPKTMIYVSLWGSVVLTAFLAIAWFVAGPWWMGAIFLVAAIICAVYAYLVRSRIPFAASLLKKVVGVIKSYPATVMISYLSLVVSIAWLALWTFGAAGAATLSQGGIIVFLLLVSLYWTMEVIRNTVHVTTSGVVATHYFLRGSGPPNPTLRAFGRAIGPSFGSICFGSLLVALIQATREMVRQARNSGDLNEFILSCLDCLLGLLESLVQFFNKYAYVQVAVYGKSFIRAAKDTWDLFKSQGIEVLINDDLIGGVLGMGMLIGGAVCAVVSGLWTLAAVDTTLAAIVAVIAFIIGFLMTSLPLVVIESGVACFYVCYAEDPAALSRTDPEFYQKITEKHRAMMAN